WDMNTPPLPLPDNQLIGTGKALWRRFREISVRKRGIGCFPFNFPGGAGRTPPPQMPNNLEAWGGNGWRGAGPSASEIAADDTVRQAFQLDLRQPQWGDFYIRRATPLPPVSSTNPPANTLSMPLGNPSRALTGLRAGYVLVATFHTHPGGYEYRYTVDSG
ncbi:hypothetical protein H0H93_008889, partial [Arthromyces matolae]